MLKRIDEFFIRRKTLNWKREKFCVWRRASKKVIYVLSCFYCCWSFTLYVCNIYYKYYGILLVFLSIIFLFSFFFSLKRREEKKKLICSVNVNGCVWNLSVKQDRIWNICGSLNLEKKMPKLFHLWKLLKKSTKNTDSDFYWKWSMWQ